MNFWEKDNNKILFVQDKKFKNFKISLNFKTALTKENATLNSLLVKVLMDGCEKYPTKKGIVNEFKKIYGSSLSASCIKNDFSLCPVFEIDALACDYSEKGVMKKAMELFGQVLLNPLLENGVFVSETVEREKKVLKNIIDGIVNDKRRYAAKRCLEISCGDNPYGVFEYGDNGVLEKCTSEMLYNHYRKIISSCAYSIVCVGNFEIDEAKECVDKLTENLGNGEICRGEALDVLGEKNIVTEESDITQGKLSMGFKTGKINDEDVYSWQIMNGLFGGGVSSKLFNEVREKMSLCYYASSNIYLNAGLIIANAGIDFGNYEKTVEAIEKQLDDICNGKFTDEEFENVKIASVNNLKMAKDDIDLLTNYYVYQIERKDIIAPEEKAEKCAAVLRECVEEKAKKVKCETVYFLCGRKEAK